VVIDSCFVDLQEEQVDDSMMQKKIGVKKVLAIVFSLAVVFSVILAQSGFLSVNCQRLIVLRIDDIQDFAFREAQLLLLDWSHEKDLTLSLAVIAGMFGEDLEVLGAVKSAVAHGSEVGVHGWKHENFVELQFWEQMQLLFQAKSRLKELLNIYPKLLVPPGFSFNEDTISSMREESYNIISTCVDYHQPTSFSGVRSIPATVETSVLEDSVWNLKSTESLLAEVEESFNSYGYAVIVTHPQELMSNGTLAETKIDSFLSLLNKLDEKCQFTTFEKLNL
jgi:hypothetical protein